MSSLLCYENYPFEEESTLPSLLLSLSSPHVVVLALANRSDFREFLTLLHEHFCLAVWTSATRWTATKLVKELFPQHILEKLVFVWDRSRCDLIQKTDTEDTDAEKTDTERASESGKNKDDKSTDSDGKRKEGEGAKADDDKRGGAHGKLTLGYSKEEGSKCNTKGSELSCYKEEGVKGDGYTNRSCNEENSTIDEKDASKIDGNTSKDHGGISNVGRKAEGTTCESSRDRDLGKPSAGGHTKEKVSTSDLKGGTDHRKVSLEGRKEYDSRDDEGGNKKCQNREYDEEDTKSNKKGDVDNCKLSNEGDKTKSSNGDNGKPSDSGCTNQGSEKTSAGDVITKTSVPTTEKKKRRRKRKSKPTLSHKDVIAVKSLTKVWSCYPRWNATNTLLIDDSPEKCPRQFRGNVVHPPPICGTYTRAEEHEEGGAVGSGAKIAVEEQDPKSTHAMVDNDKENQTMQRKFFKHLANHCAASSSSLTRHVVEFLEAHANEYNMGWQMSQP